MKTKQWQSEAATSSSTYAPNLRPISFKNSKSKSIPANPNPNPNHANLQQLPDFTRRRHWDILTTIVFSASSGNPCLCATVFDDDDDDDVPQLLHPLTLTPHLYDRPINLKLFDRHIKPLVLCTHTNNFPFDKLVITLPRAVTVDGDAMVVLYGGGKLLGRLPLVSGQNLVKWVALSEDRFDDIIATIGCTYVVDRLGKLYVINSNANSRDLSLGEPVITWLLRPLSVRVGWRKRFMLHWGRLYLVVRVEEKVFRVYKFVKGLDCWDEIEDFAASVLFVSKDCCFFVDYFVGKEYKDCIVFSESGFPKYGDDCWEYNDVDKIGVFRMADKRFGWVGESVDFPDIDWSPPSSIFDVREQDKDNGGVQSNSNVEEDTSLQKDVPASLRASVSAVEEDVTRTPLHLNAGIEATEKESSTKNTTVSALRACTPSSTTKGDKSDFATAKFEGFDIRSDLVANLQKIWRNHGSIIENSTIRNSDIIARALESLANMVLILENVDSYTNSQAEYLSSTLCDLKIMGFKVHWLVLFVEKAVKLQKLNALEDSLRKLSESSSQVQERRGILLDEVAKLDEKESKLKKEMAKVASDIRYSGATEFDGPVGSGLT